MTEVLYEHKMRISYNQHSLRKSFSRLKHAIEENTDNEIYASIGELLLWVITSDEWHKTHGKNDYMDRRNLDENGVLIKGMSHAFNCVKHNMTFFQIHHKEGGFSFPLSFLLSIDPITVHWMPASDVLNGEYKYQKKNYIKYLEGK